jgi:hypothetical protein
MVVMLVRFEPVLRLVREIAHVAVPCIVAEGVDVLVPGVFVDEPTVTGTALMIISGHRMITLCRLFFLRLDKVNFIEVNGEKRWMCI